MAEHMVTIDGNEAAATIAYQLSDIIAIYPITPSTSMGEQADAWMAQGLPNLWGTVPQVIEMQSEGGAAITGKGLPRRFVGVFRFVAAALRGIERSEASVEPGAARTGQLEVDFGEGEGTLVGIFRELHFSDELPDTCLKNPDNRIGGAKGGGLGEALACPVVVAQLKIALGL